MTNALVDTYIGVSSNFFFFNWQGEMCDLNSMETAYIIKHCICFKLSLNFI